MSARNDPKIVRSMNSMSNAVLKSYRIGPLQNPVTWYGINYIGTQIPQWDFQNKGTLTSPAQLSFVLKVPLRHLRPSIIYSVPCDRILQRAYSSPSWGHCVVLGKDTLLSQCLSPPRCINGYRQNLILGVTLHWTNILPREGVETLVC